MPIWSKSNVCRSGWWTYWLGLGTGNDENCNRNRRKGGPKKVFWYFPIIAHLNHWFANKELEFLWWHKEKHKEDARMIRHPADATQWWNIDSRNPEFVIDPRNIRITMSTNGMNPFMNSSTWPIVLMILNLPPWLCNKQKYIMMSRPILGPQQLGNDIDTYFRPLIEDLKELWYNNEMHVWDEHKHAYFGLKANLFVTISDSPVACNFGHARAHLKKMGIRL
jgi:hypothetical protein